MVLIGKKVREFLVEFSNDERVVYISEMDDDKFWVEEEVIEVLVSPEDFAQGIQHALQKMGHVCDIENLDTIFDDEETEID